MDPRLWLYLDNLRSGCDAATNLTAGQLEFAAAEAYARGFVSDAPTGSPRLTRKGEIALRLSLSESPA